MTLNLGVHNSNHSEGHLLIKGQPHSYKMATKNWASQVSLERLQEERWWKAHLSSLLSVCSVWGMKTGVLYLICKDAQGSKPRVSEGSRTHVVQLCHSWTLCIHFAMFKIKLVILTMNIRKVKVMRRLKEKAVFFFSLVLRTFHMIAILQAMKMKAGCCLRTPTQLLK